MQRTSSNGPLTHVPATAPTEPVKGDSRAPDLTALRREKLGDQAHARTERSVDLRASRFLTPTTTASGADRKSATHPDSDGWSTLAGRLASFPPEDPLKPLEAWYGAAGLVADALSAEAGAPGSLTAAQFRVRFGESIRASLIQSLETSLTATQRELDALGDVASSGELGAIELGKKRREIEQKAAVLQMDKHRLQSLEAASAQAPR